MKPSHLVLIFSLTLAPLVLTAPAMAENPEQAMKHTLIVGASVSYGYDPTTQGVQPDPATILATRYNEQAAIVKHAVPGANSSQTLPLMQQSEFDQATIAVGVDLFFWDSVFQWADCDAAVARVEGLAATMKTRNIPWVLGRIPTLPIGQAQNCQSALNGKIDYVCTQDSNCHLIDFEKIVQDVQANGGLTIYGTFYTPAEIQPDGVHLSAVASSWIADLIAKAIELKSDPYLVFGPKAPATTITRPHHG